MSRLSDSCSGPVAAMASVSASSAAVALGRPKRMRLVGPAVPLDLRVTEPTLIPIFMVTERIGDDLCREKRAPIGTFTAEGLPMLFAKWTAGTWPFDEDMPDELEFFPNFLNNPERTKLLEEYEQWFVTRRFLGWRPGFTVDFKMYNLLADGGGLGLTADQTVTELQRVLDEYKQQALARQKEAPLWREALPAVLLDMTRDYLPYILANNQNQPRRRASQQITSAPIAH